MLLQYRGRNSHMCYAPELDLYGYGPTGLEAKKSFGMVLTAYLRNRYGGIIVMEGTIWEVLFEARQRLTTQQRATVETYSPVLIYSIQSQLSSLRCPHGYVELSFEDGYVMRMAVSLLPAIQQPTISQRQQWQILDGTGFIFADSDEGYHLSQFCLDLPNSLPQ